MSSEPGRGRGVCALVVTYHPDAQLALRVAAVAAQVDAVILVDNGSDDEALAMLRRLALDPAIELIENGANLGVARALNRGVRRAAERGFDWVLTLDQDSRAAPDLIEVLFAVRAAHPEPERLAVLGAGYEDAAMPAAATVAEPWVEVESVITSGSLFALPMYRTIGPFRDEFFIDYVDTEFCFRARALGYRIARTRRALMSHEIGAPTGHRLLGTLKWTTNHSAERRYYIARNDTVMLREQGRFRHGGWALKSLGRRLRTCRRVLLYERHKAAKIAATLQGWWHGIRGRMGPRASARRPGQGPVL
ncbi:MAG: glycosyltransferase family 2 protein [Gammaproteobacteria bacterium]|nr:glycosyltransferase family 2 protein [Gammaproteobacteria bacterium]MDE2348468.1 glycosyltransferase family 2 protein [Gammaproteobacteria bacterium]